MGSYVESVDPTYLLCCDPQREIDEANRNQVESGLNFDDLMECWKAGTLPASDTPEFVALVDEAMLTTLAKAELIDHKLADRLLMVEEPKEVRAFWDLLKRGVRPMGGLGDWDKTVFETIRCREHLYEDEWTEGYFEVQLGDFRFFTGLNDPRVMVAVAWLEGDDTVQPVNDVKSRHRDNGDWILEFDSGRKTKWGKAITYVVIVHACAFDPDAFEDRSTGEEDHVVLRRGRKLKNEYVPIACIEESGELVTRTQMAYIEARKDEERWIEPITAYDRLVFFASCITKTIVIPDLITEANINAIADEVDEEVPVI